jgi:hypothetical protein
MQPPYRLLITLSLALPPAASAQHPAGLIPGPQPSQLFAAASDAPLDRTGTAQSDEPTYWKEGATFVGTIGGLAAGGFAAGLCRQEGDGSCVLDFVGGFIIGAAVGLPVGALIGGQIPKRRG